MSLQNTPAAERIHIGFFGRRNAGKSSLVNAITGQSLSVVSDIKGTTTDPVIKTMELLPLGPVVIMDTPGFDDEGALGELRMDKTRQVLARADVAVLVVNALAGMTQEDTDMLTRIRERGIPHLVVYTHGDLPVAGQLPMDACLVSSKTLAGIKERLGALLPRGAEKPITCDLLPPGGTAVLVCPIDSAAPKGRLILPQQLVLRDLLDHGRLAMVTRETELAHALEVLPEPDVVITDSQAFAAVRDIVPDRIPLTSFSILMARYKGFLASALEGVKKIDELRDGDIILISEGCTHHRQCGDIGTEKIPNWIRQKTGADIRFETSSGLGFPEDLSRYALVIHCGACMLGDREVRYRMKCAADQGIPFTNYGTAIAHMKGILKRSTEIVRHEQD